MPSSVQFQNDCNACGMVLDEISAPNKLHEYILSLGNWQDLWVCVCVFYVVVIECFAYIDNVVSE